jgi:tetratricopeptide (TPR) repeat protein
VSFWRREVIEFALDQETLRHIGEQQAWIECEPSNPAPYQNLARLYRMCGESEKALGLLLHAVNLDPRFAGAHADLAEMYAIAGDGKAAWQHARAAEENGDSRAVDLLRRYAVSGNE